MRSPRACVGAGAAILGMVVAAPAIAGAGQASDPGGQPPPGSRVEKASDFRLGNQPPAGAHVKAGTTDFRPGTQPVNPDPEPPSREPEVRDTDGGAANLPVTKDRGVKGLPVTRDRGAR